MAVTKGWIAVIGSREIPEEVACVITNYVGLMVACGYGITTGAAQGADNAAMFAVMSPDHLHLYLPWETYEEDEIRSLEQIVGRPVPKTVYKPARHTDWLQSVTKYHPCADVLSNSAIKLMARNYGIIEPAKLVVAFPKHLGSGGTGQGIRIARALNKPVIECPVFGAPWDFDSLLTRTFEVLGEKTALANWQALNSGGLLRT